MVAILYSAYDVINYAGYFVCWLMLLFNWSSVEVFWKWA